MKNDKAKKILLFPWFAYRLRFQACVWREQGAANGYAQRISPRGDREEDNGCRLSSDRAVGLYPEGEENNFWLVLWGSEPE